MPRFYFKKLVRDKIVQNCLDDPKVLHTEYRVLNQQEYITELITKISEEAAEIPLLNTAKDEALSELADVQSVIDALRNAYGFTEEEVHKEARRKAQTKGGFTSRSYIEYVELADDSEWISVFRQQPHKYKELKNE